jgi:hypothetical protein
MMTPHRFEQGFVGFVMTSQCFVGFVMASQGFFGFVMDSRRSRVSSRGGGGGSWRRRRRYQRGCCELEADDGAHRGRMRHRRLWRRHHRCHRADHESGVCRAAETVHTRNIITHGTINTTKIVSRNQFPLV